MTAPVDIYLNKDELQMLFQDLTITMLGYDELRSKWEASQGSSFDNSTVEGRSTWADDDLVSNPYYLVRIGWENSPAPKYGEDITFIRVVPQDNPYTAVRDVKIESLDEVSVNVRMSRTRVLLVAFVFMGPNAYNRAEKINDGIFHPDIKRTLSQNHIYTVPGFQSPRRAPELFNGKWWERADLSISFNNLIVKNYPVNFLRSAGIVIENETGVLKALDITELQKLAAFEDSAESAWTQSQSSTFENQ